jgi:hypothetical protein
VRVVAEAAEEAELEDAGALWNSLGYHLNKLADYAGAKPYLERALEIYEAVLGPEHPYTAGSLNNLGFYLWLVQAARQRILEGDFVNWKNQLLPKITTRLN